MAQARQLFSNLPSRKPNPHFPVALVAYLREGNSACPTLYKIGTLETVDFPAFFCQPPSGIMTPRTYRYVRVCTDLSDHILCSPTSLHIFGRTNISKDVPRHLLIYLYVQVHTFYQNTYSYVLVCTSTGISWYIVVHDSTKRYISIH